MKSREKRMKAVRERTNTHKTLSRAGLVDMKDYIIPLPGSTIYSITCKLGERLHLPQEGRLFKHRAAANKHSKYYFSICGSFQELRANITSSCRSQPLGVTCAASRSILDSNPLKNNLLMCRGEKIQFRRVPGQDIIFHHL